ncbi:hypothetical protein GCM10009789_69400 [Kribbella sancticallisti]|uniref:DUF4180 domain-containing protein n=1 Tax=Kribbella sancticallisti TaxID=460087 RepID=A0ABN2EJX0_9ACTN
MNTYTATTPVTSEQDAVDLIGEASYWHQAEWVLVPVELLPPEFFQLQTKVAGPIVQKFAQYGMGLVIVGDVSTHVAASSPFRDWVRESNRGRQLRFMPDVATALDCLHGRGSDSAVTGDGSAGDPPAGLA